MGLNTHFGGEDMNKKLGRALRPGLTACFILLFGFGLAALLTQQYVVGAVEIALSLVVVISYVLDWRNRKREIHQFIRNTFQTQDLSQHAESPLPMALVRLGDNGIVWASERFNSVTSYRPRVPEQRVDEVLPGLTLDWLSAGKTEYPYDVTIDKRRYRVYGTIIRADDVHGTMLAMLYLSDMTEMYQIRDEYIRSRPVVSIILVDNYEELTMNLSESAISNMNAEINDAITKWAEAYHGLLRKLERNRYLLVFEKRDLEHAMQEKFSLLGISTRWSILPAWRLPFPSAWAWTVSALKKATILPHCPSKWL